MESSRYWDHVKLTVLLSTRVLLLQWSRWLFRFPLAIFVAHSVLPLKIWLEPCIEAIMYNFNLYSYQHPCVALYPGHPYPPPDTPPPSTTTPLLIHQMLQDCYDTCFIASYILYLRFWPLCMCLQVLSGALDAVKHGWTGSAHCFSSLHLSFRPKIMFKGSARSYTMPL